MQFSEFTFKIVLLFLPGIIAFTIIDKLTAHKEIKLHRMLLNSLMLGCVCYFAYYLMLIIIEKIPWFSFDLECLFVKTLTDNSVQLDIKEIVITTVLSVPIGFIFSGLINYKVLYRVAHRVKASKKFGDVDVWSYIMNSEVPEWVIIRDIKNDLMYEGWIQVFSDNTEKDELFLRDVKVYKNSTAEELYETPGLYLPRERECLTVEFPSLEFSEYKERIYEKKEEQNG